MVGMISTAVNSGPGNVPSTSNWVCGVLLWIAGLLECGVPHALCAVYAPTVVHILSTGAVVGEFNLSMLVYSVWVMSG